ncbi:hypothetical protein DH2020_022522 [Rehmannia glutinosa]|uniref:Uncharacterized protein n=1 Tax=Rehmannia glutinosa TaxID=99300 RepID=A0ABR0WE36_REHGL
MDSESRAYSQSSAEPRSEPKVLVGQKRDIMEAEEETSECSQKRMKLSALESVWPSKADGGIGGHNTVHQNVNVDPVKVIKESNKVLTFAKEEKNGRFDLDLNAEDMSSSINTDPFYPSNNDKHLKSRNDSECGSSVGLLDEKDSMRVWKGLKQNNYMPTLHGAVPMPMPMKKTRGRKKNNDDAMKKKIELAKKEQVDRFAKVAAPSGLLNGLNPGIINHVRNSKQVYSIIGALMRSEKTENQRFGRMQINNGPVDVLLEARQLGDYGLFGKSNCLSSEVNRGDGHSYMGETRIFERLPSKCDIENKDDGLALKLSSSVTVASENTSCLSIEGSENLKTVTSLSVKAANVASQWLELLNQDVKGRLAGVKYLLAALRRSKKRVRDVITTELPDLISREFSSNLDTDSYVTKGFDKASADGHVVRWSTLFGQMDKALSEEETHLENWLNQVKEMQLHCERGICNRLHNILQETDPTGNNYRLGEAHHNSEKDLAVRAAAASIYSTCNFLLTMENLPLFYHVTLDAEFIEVLDQFPVYFSLRAAENSVLVFVFY